MTKVHTLHMNEEQLTLPPWGLLDAKGALQAFSCHTEQRAKGSHSSEFKRGTAGTAEREPASHLCRRHHSNNFSSPSIAFSLIKKHSYIAYPLLFSLTILLGNNINITGTWQIGT